MTNKALYLIMFTTGAAIGAAVAWYTTKGHYAEVAQEEIESVKRHYRFKSSGDTIWKGLQNGIEEAEKKQIIANEARNKPSISEYAKRLQNAGYGNTDESADDANGPYVISPEEFGEFADYEEISLTYYSDGILTDDNDEIIADVGGTVGTGFAKHFGEYEDDSVFIRNDARNCDYEILFDQRTYEEASENKPHQVEV